MTALSGTVTPTRRLFCVISTARCHRAGEFSSSWRESASLSLWRATGSKYKARSVEWMKYFRIPSVKSCSFCVYVQERKKKKSSLALASLNRIQCTPCMFFIVVLKCLIYLCFRDVSSFIQFISSSDRFCRETCGNAPSVWRGCAARASLQTQGHQALRVADVSCSCPAPTSSTSRVWKPSKPLSFRADPPVPCADLCTTRNWSKEVQLLMRSKNHRWNQIAGIPEPVRVDLHHPLPLRRCKRKLTGPRLAPYSFVRAQTVALILFILLLATNIMSTSKEVSHLH